MFVESEEETETREQFLARRNAEQNANIGYFIYLILFFVFTFYSC
jgi:hypothetical protein